MSDMPASTKAVLAISSQVARGSVGLRAAGFAIERLGVPVWKAPTVFLPWHPGHTKTYGPPPRANMPDDVFSQSLEAISNAPFAGEVGAVLTGYFATTSQVKATAQAIDALRAINPDLVVVCDPVSADSHGTYVPADLVQAIQEQLVPRASVLTPNRFELALLTGSEEPGETNSDLVRQTQTLGVPRILVTSAHGLMRGHTGALLVDDKRAMLAEHRQVDGAPHGTGDLFSALFTAHTLLGVSPENAVMKAIASVFEVVARSVQTGEQELAIAREQDSIARPMAMVTQRQIALPKPVKTTEP